MKPDYDAGDLVVCIDDSLNHQGVCLVKKGSIYRCLAIIVDKPEPPWTDFEMPLATVLKDFPNGYSFACWRFKKFDDIADDIFVEALRKTKTSKVIETV